MEFQTVTALKQAYIDQLQRLGRSVQVDVPIGDSGGVIDVLTDTEIVLCALELTSQSALSLSSKLRFYGQFSPGWKKVAVVQRIIDTDASDLLEASDVELRIISPTNMSAAGASLTGNQSRKRSLDSKPSKLVHTKSVYRYPALDSVNGGDGWRASVVAIIAVLLIAAIGMSVSSVRTSGELLPENSLER